jgi:hypothetical protein
VNDWKAKIIDAFINRSFSSAIGDRIAERNTLRLRSVSIFPDFITAAPDEKESYLEAAETLERNGVITLNWEKRGKGERLKTLTCGDMGKLFEESGGKDPKTAAGEIRSLFGEKALTFDSPLLHYLAQHFGPAEIGRGMDRKAVEDLVRLLEIFLSPEKQEKLTTRALSISLYNDSKRLEHLISLFNPLLAQACKQGIPAPDLSSLQRSLPETMIAGKLIFEYEGDNPPPSLSNASGIMLGFPLQGIRKIHGIKTVEPKDKPAVLTIENKETFYALADLQEDSQYCGQGSLSPIDAFLYVGGYLNQADAAMIKILSDSGFYLYHAGDLDPDGILILQNIMDVTGKPVSPVGMDAAVFDRYLPFARPLTLTMLAQIKKIRDDTKAISGIADLVRRIEETGRGVEQEIVDYRGRD